MAKSLSIRWPFRAPAETEVHCTLSSTASIAAAALTSRTVPIQTAKASFDPLPAAGFGRTRDSAWIVQF
jgi:hypothetical protein